MRVSSAGAQRRHAGPKRCGWRRGWRGNAAAARATACHAAGTRHRPAGGTRLARRPLCQRYLSRHGMQRRRCPPCVGHSRRAACAACNAAVVVLLRRLIQLAAGGGQRRAPTVVHHRLQWRRCMLSWCCCCCRPAAATWRVTERRPGRLSRFQPRHHRCRHQVIAVTARRHRPLALALCRIAICKLLALGAAHLHRVIERVIVIVTATAADAAAANHRRRGCEIQHERRHLPCICALLQLDLPRAPHALPQQQLAQRHPRHGAPGLVGGGDRRFPSRAQIPRHHRLNASCPRPSKHAGEATVPSDCFLSVAAACGRRNKVLIVVVVCRAMSKGRMVGEGTAGTEINNGRRRGNKIKP